MLLQDGREEGRGRGGEGRAGKRTRGGRVDGKCGEMEERRKRERR